MIAAEPQFRGRVRELALLSEHLRRAVAGAQQLVLIEGDPGVGKSALLRAFARAGEGAAHRARYFYLSAPEAGDYLPVEHAALAIRRRAYKRFGRDRQATELAASLAVDWVSAVPVWGNLFGAVGATLRALRRRRRPPGTTSHPLADEHTAALIRAAKRRPLVLLLDDLHRADEEAVSRLETLITVADEGERIMIVGAYRPPAPGLRAPPIHALRKRLPEQDEIYTYHRLEALAAPDLAAWLREHFGASPAEEFVSWLHGATGGHPATVVATVRHLLSTGAVTRDGDGWHYSTDAKLLELPAVGHSFGDLSALNPHIAEVVISAAALGDEFDAASLSDVLQRHELVVEDQLALGVHYGLLVNLGERRASDGDPTTAYRFTSGHLRAALLASMETSRRALLEERAAALRSGSSPRLPTPHPD